MFHVPGFIDGLTRVLFRPKCSLQSASVAHRFYTTVREKDGDDYEPDGVRVMVNNYSPKWRWLVVDICTSP